MNWYNMAAITHRQQPCSAWLCNPVHAQSSKNACPVLCTYGNFDASIDSSNGNVPLMAEVILADMMAGAARQLLPLCTAVLQHASSNFF